MSGKHSPYLKYVGELNPETRLGYHFLDRLGCELFRSFEFVHWQHLQISLSAAVQFQ
jgi:hypothetical protein